MNGIIAEFAEVSKLYGTFAALRKVSVQFERGRCYLVLGPNGAGKSTLLRTLAGLLRPSYGKVLIFGADGSSEESDGGSGAHRVHEPRHDAVRRVFGRGEFAVFCEPVSRAGLRVAGGGAAQCGAGSSAGSGRWGSIRRG